MELKMRKLALWHTRTFRPITTHQELEPIMTTLGFEPLPVYSPPGSTAWKEYAFRAADRNKLPRPRLPYPRIDGSHLLTYRAFVDSVGFYLGVHLVPDHFHVRAMPLHRVDDRKFDKVFRQMMIDQRMNDDCMYVFREETLDQTTLQFCNGNNNNGNNSSKGSIINNSNTNNSICLVSLKDIIPLKDIAV